MGFCDEIKYIRRMSLLSQEAFAQVLGVSFTTVNRWETGKSKPNYKTMKLIDTFCKSNSIPFDVTEQIMSERDKENGK